jgi:hypothetical protein
VAIEGEFLTLMPDTVTVYPADSRDSYGKVTHNGTGVEYRCRVRPEQRVMKDAQGREVDVIGKVYLHGAPTVAADARLVLPDGSEPVIIAVDHIGDDAGDHHVVLVIGR